MNKTHKISKSIDLESFADFEEIIELSKTPDIKGVLVFKHSPRCGVSKMVARQFFEEWPFSPDELPVYLVDVISRRDVSQKIGAHLSVWHESPQIILLNNGKVAGNASHFEASVMNVERWLK